VVIDKVDIHLGGLELFKRLDEASGFAKPGVRPAVVFGSTHHKNWTVWIIVLSLLIVGLCVVMMSCVVFILYIGLHKNQCESRLGHEVDDEVSVKDDHSPSKISSTALTINTSRVGQRLSFGQPENEDGEGSALSPTFSVRGNKHASKNNRFPYWKELIVNSNEHIEGCFENRDEEEIQSFESSSYSQARSTGRII
jgi:hypothetical protein